jgi:hypothetical protein
MLVCGIGLNRRKELVTLSLGTASLITRDKALIASENPPFGLLKKALTPINKGDALVKAKIHRESAGICCFFVLLRRLLRWLITWSMAASVPWS